MKNLVSRLTVAASLLLTVSAAGRTPKGCYKKVEPPLKDMGEKQYQSRGLCTDTCKGLKKPVMALWGGSNCLCGDKLPPEDQKTDDKKCNAGCQGTDEETCMSFFFKKKYFLLPSILGDLAD